MSMRTFLDSEGREWHAFDVIPREEERRGYDRRSGDARIPVSDDRRGNDRRITIGRRSVLTSVSPGWLCFERMAGKGGADERRRLSPIPIDWRRCSDATIEQYRREARPVRRESSSAAELSDRGY